MYEKLAFLEKRFEELGASISDPEIISNQEVWRKLMKEHSDLEEIVEKYREYKKYVDSIKEDKQMLESEKDADLREMLSAEIDEYNSKLPAVEEELKVLLLPKDPNDEKKRYC